VRRSWKFLEAVVAKNKALPCSPDVVHLRTNTRTLGVPKNCRKMVVEAFSRWQNQRERLWGQGTSHKPQSPGPEHWSLPCFVSFHFFLFSC